MPQSLGQSTHNPHERELLQGAAAAARRDRSCSFMAQNACARRRDRTGADWPTICSYPICAEMIQFNAIALHSISPGAISTTAAAAADGLPQANISAGAGATAAQAGGDADATARLDDAIEQSFPASDPPPGWTHIGPPRRRGAREAVKGSVVNNPQGGFE